MILIDANLLLYAYDSDSPRHQECRDWLEAQFSGSAPVRLAWSTVYAFVRIITNPRVYHRPYSIGEAGIVVSRWLEMPAVEILHPGERHWSILQGLLESGQIVGPLVMDAVLAALAIEHGAILCTTDRDFTRFRGLRTNYPLK